jgi:hypothetical protein
MDRESLIEFLETEFDGSRVRDLETVPGGARMGGTLVWDGFKDLDPIDRQHKLWSALRERFNREELRSISLLLAFTAAEVEAIMGD